MKKLCFLLALAFAAGITNGQVRVGALGGLHVASVKENPFNSGYSSKSGWHLGLVGDIPLTQTASNRWFIQPGLQYMTKGRKFYAHYDSATILQSDTFFLSNSLSVNYIEMPLNIAYKFPISKHAKFVISAGPYLGFFFNGKQKFDTKTYSDNAFKGQETDIEAGSDVGKVKTFDVGLNGRAGFEIGNFFISGFASWGLSDFYNSAHNATFKHRIGGGSVGFWLNRTKKPQTPTTTIDLTDLNKDAIIKKEEVVVFDQAPIPLPPADDIVKGPLFNFENSRKLAEEQLHFAAKKIFFDPNSENLTKTSAEPLDEVVKLLSANPSYRLTIEGHTDASGNVQKNRALSQRRAEAVKKYLIEKGVESSRLIAIGYGSDRPLDTNKTPEGRAANRRVDMMLEAD